MNYFKIIRGFLPVILFSLCIPANANTLVISEDKIYSLKGHMEAVAVDEEVPFEKARLESFYENAKVKYSDGKNVNKYWVRFKLRNEGPGQNFYFTINNFRVNHAEFYSQTETGEYARQLAGVDYPLRQWPEKYRHPVFKFFLPEKKETAYYFYFSTEGMVGFVPYIHPEKIFIQKKSYEKIFQNIDLFITVLFCMVLFFYYRQRKDNHFLLLIYLSIMFYIYLFVSTINSYQYWHEYPKIQQNVLYFVSWFALVSFLYLFKKYYPLDKKWKIVDWFFNAGFILLTPVFIMIFYKTYFFRLWYVYCSVFILLLINLRLFIAFFTEGGRTKYVLYYYMVIEATPIMKFLESPNVDYLNFMMYPFSSLVLFFIAYDDYKSINQEINYLRMKYESGVEKIPDESKIETTEEKSREIPDDETKFRKGNRVDAASKYLVLEKISVMLEDKENFVTNATSLDSMALFLNIRRDQLSEIINKEFNTNFNSFVNKIRIERACELLRNFPDKNITEIYLDCGFNSKAPFNRAFYNVMNESPSDYRVRVIKPQNGG